MKRSGMWLTLIIWAVLGITVTCFSGGGEDDDDDDVIGGSNNDDTDEDYWGCADFSDDPIDGRKCGDWDWDDDDLDDCYEELGDNVEVCFDDVTSEYVCDSVEADCWLTCFHVSETCDDWSECVGASCDSPGSDDDEPNENAPLLSNGAWDPATIGPDILSVLVWEVCDLENNLSGGQIFVWISGTTDPFLADEVFWDGFPGGAPHAPDCGAPVPVGIYVNFEGVPGGTYCCDLEATDGDGDLSNTLTNLCVTAP